MFGGKCAYCGKPLGKMFHADHVAPIYRGWTDASRPRHAGKDVEENLFPACPRCNIRKGVFSVEAFRDEVTMQLKRLRRDSSAFNLAEDFGIIEETGKPVVLVLIWGRPTSINFGNKYCPAVLAAGYPGAQGGLAIAEALKGDYTPGGKLNGTWPKTVGQLPMNIPTKPNANMEELHYHTVANKGLLYCFGHGLSYTQFKYENLNLLF